MTVRPLTLVGGSAAFLPVVDNFRPVDNFRGDRQDLSSLCRYENTRFHGWSGGRFDPR
jgi:hypothetical protein